MIDLDRYSLDGLLKMARSLGLIDYYEKDARHVLLLLSGRRHRVTHRHARTFLHEQLTAWWEQQFAAQQNPQENG